MRDLSLDGLRGIAVLAVVLVHHNLVHSGWMGVDLFFVLSGYLITTILRRTRDDRFFWKQFWIKRVTRILPPFVLLLCMAQLLTPRSSPFQIVCYLLTLGDLLAYKRREFEILRPLWSLAVEEHFYLLWPFAVRFLKRRTLVYILVAVVVLEPTVRALASLHSHDWTLVYFLTPFRLDGLSLGCLLALGLESEEVTRRLKSYSAVGFGASLIVFAALRVILGTGFTHDDPTTTYNAACYSLVALLAVTLIAYVITHPDSFLKRGLAWKPLVFVGTISYGVYLYQVVITTATMRLFGVSHHQAFLIDLPVVLGFAWLSFHFYEQPMIAWGKRRAQRLHRASVAGDYASS